MAARTGEQFLRGLAGRRDLWVGGDKISSVVDHPALSGAARALAEVFDLQYRQADVCLMPDPETGEPINVSHMIPRSREDLQRRHRGLEYVAEYSVGLMGRTPDYMNVTFAGFAGRADEWAINGNERGAQNLVRYQKKLAARICHSPIRLFIRPSTCPRAGIRSVTIRCSSTRSARRHTASSCGVRAC
jgi:4-hydroxyphenylacetate 3-monooxygenase